MPWVSGTSDRCAQHSHRFRGCRHALPPADAGEQVCPVGSADGHFLAAFQVYRMGVEAFDTAQVDDVGPVYPDKPIRRQDAAHLFHREVGEPGARQRDHLHVVGIRLDV